jgi:alcohol dehydrogenase
MQAGLKLGLIDPVVASIVGPVPFHGPFGIGHECVAQVTAVGADVVGVRTGDVVIVPWAVSCGSCYECRLGLTAKCSTMRAASMPPATTSRTPGAPSCRRCAYGPADAFS